MHVAKIPDQQTAYQHLSRATGTTFGAFMAICAVAGWTAHVVIDGNAPLRLFLWGFQGDETRILLRFTVPPDDAIQRLCWTIFATDMLDAIEAGGPIDVLFPTISCEK